MLFEVTRKAGKSPTSRAAGAITSATDVPISPAYLWQLQSGTKRNSAVMPLTAFFGLSASYWIDRDTD